MFFVVVKTMAKSSSGSQIINNSPSEEVAIATSSYVLGSNIMKEWGTQ